MLDGQKFYFASMRKLTIAFGDLFNNIHVSRKDEDGEEVRDIKVPLAYAAKQHYISRLRQDVQSTDPAMAMNLPRLSFEIGSITYDPARQVSPTSTMCNGLIKDTVNSATIHRVLNPVPYDFTFELTAYSKNTDDGLQIIEQIIPWFTPEFNITIIELPSLGVKSDVPFILDSITPGDNYQEGFDNNRLITWDMSFTAKGWIYKPTGDVNLIKQIFSNIDDIDDNDNTYETIGVEVDPLSANIDDMWNPLVTIT